MSREPHPPGTSKHWHTDATTHCVVARMPEGSRRLRLEQMHPDMLIARSQAVRSASPPLSRAARPVCLPWNDSRSGEFGVVSLVAREVHRINVVGRVAEILNMGAGRRSPVEDGLHGAGGRFWVDRIDVAECTITHPRVRACVLGTIEDMPQMGAEAYDIALSVFVLEHVDDVRSALSEAARVLRPGGLLVLVVPNPETPEFLFARFSPLWVHRIFQPEGFRTPYAYPSARALASDILRAGFVIEGATCAPVIKAYVQRVLPWLAPLAGLYDRLVVSVGASRLCGAYLIVARKAS